MKSLIAALAVLLAAQAHAAPCAKELFHQSGHDEGSLIETIEHLPDTGVKMSADRVKLWNKTYAKDFDAISKECIESMNVALLRGPSGKLYVQMTTIEDQCDGGNTYGLITDINNEIVVDISDSYYSCPAKKK